MTTLVVLSLERWDEVWRRNQHLVHRLLLTDPDLRVLFVEPAADPVHAARRGGMPRPGRGRREIPGYGGRLTAFEPTKWLPRAMGARADVSLQRQVARAARRTLGAADVLWINDPMWWRLADGRTPTLYDITDDWTLADDNGDARRSRLRAADAHLVTAGDVVVVCSRELQRTKGGERPVVLIPNAVDTRAYRGAIPRPPDLPARAAVYAGTLHEHRLDVDLVIAAADSARESNGTIVLVGPDALSPDVSRRLAAHPAIRMLGARRAVELPAYLVHADVLLVPHVVSAFTDTLDPIKLYEYLAAGRPVVSTPVAGFRESDAAAITVAGREEFAGIVAQRLLHRLPATVTPDVPDWSRRADAMRHVIEDLSAR